MAGARSQDNSALLSEDGRWYGATGRNYNEVPVRLGLSAASTVGGSTLSYHDIVYSVKEKLLPCSKGVEKNVLKGVSGIMKPGVNAIAGPTGVGKTTLLDILSGRRSSSNPNSRVLLNGEPLPAYYNCMSGYVVQEDVLMGTLTVKENIEFSASLRIPGGISSTERKSRVNSLLKELGLEEVADSKIGTKMVRGVSGGEKKRTSIAMELVASPAVLYLDEPTTGLDAFTAVQIMQILYKYNKDFECI
jgi:ATP-binding cassette subfamily G (WHITE) protein 2